MYTYTIQVYYKTWYSLFLAYVQVRIVHFINIHSYHYICFIFHYFVIALDAYQYLLYIHVIYLQAILASIIVVALQMLFRQAMDIKKYYYLSIPDMVWGIILVIIVM